MTKTVTILDGGMGQELVARAGGTTDLWSLKALFDAPEMVRAVHDDFFAAGADVATTNTYMTFPDRLEPKGLGDALEPLTHRACELAVQARDAKGGGVVAGSMGPLGFTYQPDLAPPADQAAEIYARMAQLHVPYVDVHLLETMASVDQAKGALMGASVTGKPVWLAVSVDDADGTRLRSGEPLSDLGPLIRAYEPEVVFINCSKPEAVSQGIGVLSAWGTFGAYANGFTGIHADYNSIHATSNLLTARKDLGPEDYLAFAKTWATAGASYIGGCCEVGPAHIRALSRYFSGR